MGSFLSRLWWGPEPAKPGGVDRKGSLPADYDEWKPRYYEPEVRKPDPPVIRPAPEPEIIPKSTPEVTELQRVHETKVEHEKITNDSGSTTEKTQYTQITESMRIQEGKGPIAEPFDSSKQHTVFPTFTELKTSVDTSPTADVKRHEIHILAPKAEVEDISESEKTEDEKEDAIVKIQAGVRGYLTRKALKERSVTPEPPPRPVSEDIVEKESSKSVQATSPTELKKESSAVSPLAQHTTQASDEEQEEEDSAEAEEAATKIQAAFRGYKVRKQGRPDPPARKNNQQIVVDLDEDEEEEEEEDESDEGTVSESDE